MPGVCPRCNRNVYFAEERLALGKVWHSFCFSCRNCRKLLDSCTVATHYGEIFCKNCYDRSFSPYGNYEIKAIPRASQGVSLTISNQDSAKCPFNNKENPNKEITLNAKQIYRFAKGRLRGGGNGKEEKSPVLYLKHEKKYCLDTGCANAYDTCPTAAICDPSRGPVNFVKSFPRSSNGHCEQYQVQHRETNQTKRNIQRIVSASDYEIEITEGQVSDKITISPRRKSTYVPEQLSRGPLASQRRVSFCDVIFGDTCNGDRNSARKMQDNRHRPCYDDASEDYDPSYNIWQADDSADKNNIAGYEATPSPNQNDETNPQDCNAPNCCESAEDTCVKCDEINRNYVPSNCEAENNESVSNGQPTENNPNEHIPPNKTEYGMNDIEDNERMRGGCGGCLRRLATSRRSSLKTPQKTSCGHCGQRSSYGCPARQSSCPPPKDECCKSGCCPPANCPPICKKTIKCYQPCEGDQGCGSGGCCGGSGCRGGCGKPGQLCMPLRTCPTPPRRPCSPTRPGSPCFVTPPCTPCSPCSPPPCSPRVSCSPSPCSPPPCSPPPCSPPPCSPSPCSPCSPSPCSPCSPSPCSSSPCSPCSPPPCSPSPCPSPCSPPPCSPPPCSPPSCSPCSPPSCSPCPPPSCSPCPPPSCSPCSPPPCSPPRPCPPTPCCGRPRKSGDCGGCGSGPKCCAVPADPCCGRSKSRGSRGCCGEGTRVTDTGCFRVKVPCGECLGGGLDCQRCGRKVYQAEMQIVSGVPYHLICFSCFCCRKPLESLTYQENCGEIYCKQCYIRNFGPQGYGYGVGAGALQTPI